MTPPPLLHFPPIPPPFPPHSPPFPPIFPHFPPSPPLTSPHFPPISHHLFPSFPICPTRVRGPRDAGSGYLRALSPRPASRCSTAPCRPLCRGKLPWFFRSTRTEEDLLFSWFEGLMGGRCAAVAEHLKTYVPCRCGRSVARARPPTLPRERPVAPQNVPWLAPQACTPLPAGLFVRPFMSNPRPKDAADSVHRNAQSEARPNLHPIDNNGHADECCGNGTGPPTNA